VTTTATRPRQAPAPERPRTLAAKARSRLAGLGRTEHTCSCGMHTASRLKWQTHKCIEMGGLWASKAARAAGKAMGPARDAARKAAVKARIATGLTEVRTRTVTRTDKKGNVRTGKDGKPVQFTETYAARTEHGDSRPRLPKRPSRSHLRDQQDHTDDGRRASEHEGHAKRLKSIAEGHAAAAKERAATASTHATQGHRFRALPHKAAASVHERLSARHQARAGDRAARADTIRAHWRERARTS
jgi:hypothetical protein